jgi:hypothetical protein
LTLCRGQGNGSKNVHSWHAPPSLFIPPSTPAIKLAKEKPDTLRAFFSLSLLS